MMNAIPANRPNLDAACRMPVAELLALPAEHPALLQEDARATLGAANRKVVILGKNGIGKAGALMACSLPTHLLLSGGNQDQGVSE